MNKSATPSVLIKDVKTNPKVVALINGANEVMLAMGYTEHGHRHVGIVSSITRYIMENLDMPQREIELGMIAGYLHDIGNVINRIDHPISGANISYDLLTEMGMPTEEIAPILGAIGNHEELAGTPVSYMSAALIIADKSDVHYSRVQNPVLETFDIHDRVNYAVQKSRVEMDNKSKTITLTLEIDTEFASVMEYFEIFLSRMVMCRRAASLFGYEFRLSVNGTLLE
ncbi:MAG TPA: HD domain-containing protein [Fimbriimonadaceae bacterium]|nr:HD domain-containing protein [Fimbriimonadaceae bacterium]